MWGKASGEAGQQYAAGTPPVALFVCEDPPTDAQSGAASYNLVIFRVLEKLGYDVRVIVTSQQTSRLWPVLRLGPRVEFVNARRVGRLILPATFPAALRFLHHLLLRLGLTRIGRRKGQVAHFGRWLSDREVAAVRRSAAAIVPDLVVVDTIFRSGALAAAPETSSLLVAHDVFSERAASFRANGMEVGISLTGQEEAALWQRFDGVIAIRSEDEALIAQATGRPVETVFPTAVRTSVPCVTGVRPPRFFFLGTAAYHNVDGLGWFLDAVWPQVLATHPHAALDVVGTISRAFVTPVPGVTFHGRVDAIEPIAAACRAAINPVRMGSGIKIKMVDYFALGMPCVVTTLGAVGFPQAPTPPFVTADAPQAFAAALCDLIDSPAHAAALAARIPAYLHHFTEDAAVEAMQRLIGSATSEANINWPGAASAR